VSQLYSQLHITFRALSRTRRKSTVYLGITTLPEEKEI